MLKLLRRYSREILKAMSATETQNDDNVTKKPEEFQLGPVRCLSYFICCDSPPKLSFYFVPIELKELKSHGSSPECNDIT